jgi:hypothetical protein
MSFHFQIQQNSEPYNMDTTLSTKKQQLIFVMTRKLRRCLYIKNVVFCDVTPRGSCKNRRFGGTYRVHLQTEKNQQARNKVSSSTLRRIHHYIRKEGIE